LPHVVQAEHTRSVVVVHAWVTYEPEAQGVVVHDRQTRLLDAVHGAAWYVPAEQLVEQALQRAVDVAVQGAV
jgi:hypothetical protein